MKIKLYISIQFKVLYRHDCVYTQYSQSIWHKTSYITTVTNNKNKMLSNEQEYNKKYKLIKYTIYTLYSKVWRFLRIFIQIIFVLFVLLCSGGGNYFIKKYNKNSNIDKYDEFQ